MMKLLLDFFPLVVFFVAYKMAGIYTATAVLMAATVVQMGAVKLLEGKLQTLHKVTLVMVLIFGALTLFLQDERFIKWKPTVLYGAMALVLGVMLWVMRKNVLKLLLGAQMELPETVWQRLGAAWVGYCVFMATLNGYVAAAFSTEAWVNFKLWGYVFPLLFIIGQGFYVARHWKDPEEAIPPEAKP
jgi:intracellular septation protein